MRSFCWLLPPPAASFCWSVFPKMRFLYELAFCSESRLDLEPCLVPYLPQLASCGGHPPTRGFFWFHSSAKYSRLSFDAGCPKGPGGTETRMAATRSAIGSAGSYLLCSKASDTFLSAPRRQANRGAGKTFVDLTEEGEQMLSPFEQHRLNNIAENERMLQQLG